MVAAIGLFVYAKSPLKLRCDYGSGGIFGAPLQAGYCVNVLAKNDKDGEYQCVAEKLYVIENAPWQFENGSNIAYVKLDATLAQKWSTIGYSKYKLIMTSPDW